MHKPHEPVEDIDGGDVAEQVLQIIFAQPVADLLTSGQILDVTLQHNQSKYYIQHILHAQKLQLLHIRRTLTCLRFVQHNIS